MAEEIQHGGYRVRYAPADGSFKARAFGDTGNFQEFTGTTAFEVIERAKAWIDETIRATIAARRVAHPGTWHEVEIATLREYVAFFQRRG